MLSRVVGTNHHHHGAKPSALRPSYQPSAPRPTYHFIWPIHHYQHHHHSAELPAPRPTFHFILWPSHYINHHHHWAKPSAPRPTPWAESSLLTSPQHPYPWAHPSVLATAIQPAHPSYIPTISNGPIIGWPVSHGTLSTSAVRYRWTKTLKGLRHEGIHSVSLEG